MYVVGVSIPKYILYFLKNTFTFLLVFFGKSFMCFSIARVQCFGSNVDLACIWLGSGLYLPCIWLGSGLGLAWIWFGSGLDLDWIWLGSGLDLAWI